MVIFTAPVRQYAFYSHFLDEKLEAQKRIAPPESRDSKKAEEEPQIPHFPPKQVQPSKKFSLVSIIL